MGWFIRYILLRLLIILLVFALGLVLATVIMSLLSSCTPLWEVSQRTWVAPVFVSGIHKHPLEIIDCRANMAVWVCPLFG